jgi:hypothetical protein
MPTVGASRKCTLTPVFRCADLPGANRYHLPRKCTLTPVPCDPMAAKLVRRSESYRLRLRLAGITVRRYNTYRDTQFRRHGQRRPVSWGRQSSCKSGVSGRVVAGITAQDDTTQSSYRSSRAGDPTREPAGAANRCETRTTQHSYQSAVSPLFSMGGWLCRRS